MTVSGIRSRSFRQGCWLINIYEDCYVDNHVCRADFVNKFVHEYIQGKFSGKIRFVKYFTVVPTLLHR